MRALAAVALGAVVLALVVVQYGPFRHRLPRMGRLTEGWPRQRSWWPPVLWCAVLLAGLGVALVLIATVPPDSDAEPLVRLSGLIVIVGTGLLLKRRNRRDGVKPVEPMQHGPPGWVWDPDRVTWRPPD